MPHALYTDNNMAVVLVHSTITNNDALDKSNSCVTTEDNNIRVNTFQSPSAGDVHIINSRAGTNSSVVFSQRTYYINLTCVCDNIDSNNERFRQTDLPMLGPNLAYRISSSTIDIHPFITSQ